MAARKAVEAKDSKKAAAELRAVANELKAQSGRATPIDNSRTPAETKLAQDIARRLQAIAMEVDDAAGALESGKLRTEAELDKVMDRAARANMDRRWEVTDVATRYPLSEEPQRHFTDAMAAFEKRTTRPPLPASAKQPASCASRPVGQQGRSGRRSTARLPNSTSLPLRSRKAR